MLKSKILKNQIIIYGKHAVMAAILNNNRKIEGVYISSKDFDTDNKIKKILERKKLKILRVTKKTIENILQKQVKHQGIIALAEKLNINSYKKVFNSTKINKQSEKQIGVILDGINDPNNIGAIYRTSYAFGADFILSSNNNFPEESSSILNAACGTYEKIVSYKTSNLNQSIIQFKKLNWWIVGLDHNAKLQINNFSREKYDFNKMLIVLGSEGRGIRELVKKNCDFLFQIKTFEQNMSLNVSNAASIFLYEIYKKLHCN